jgi:LuxR family maltose regulon positive regulatory protein
MDSSQTGTRTITQEPLLATKLFTPPLRARLVMRQQLLERLNACHECGVILLSAPAGYGKTTLLATWAQTVQCPLAWLSLDAADNDPVRFLRYLIVALQQIKTAIGRDVQRALASPQPPPPTLLINLLINDLASIGADRTLLVLDDFQLIEEIAVHEMVQTVVAHRPSTLQLVIATREDPPLPLARLRARNELAELRAHDLRFSSEEATHFLSEVMGLSLPATALAALDEQIEGWPAGLQLAALSMQKHEDPAAAITALSGNHYFILNYLTEEVLRQLPSQHQQFLLESAVLPSFTAPLCDAITGRQDSLAVIEELHAANIFVTPLDAARTWWRYHPLFADLLRAQLQHTQPARAAELRSRASAWFEAHERYNDAIDLAFAAEDFARAARLIDASARQTMMQGYLRTVESWLHLLPEPWRTAQPHATLAFAWSLILRGLLAEVEPYLRRAEAAAERLQQEAAEEAAAIEAETLSLRSVLMALRGDPARGCELARAAVAMAPADNQYVQGTTLFALGTTCNYADAGDEAIASYQKALPLCHASGNHVAAGLIVGNLTLLYLVRGQLHAAARLCRQVLAATEQSETPGSPALASVIGGYSSLLYEWNDLDNATIHALRALTTARLSGHVAAIAYGNVTYSRILLAQGRIEEAGAALAQAHEIGQRGMPAWVAPHITAQQVVLMLARGDSHAAEHALLQHGVTLTTPINHNTEIVHLAWLRLLLQQASESSAPQHLLESARDLATRVLKSVTAAGRMGRAIEAFALRARLFHALNDPAAACNDLRHALILAESEEYIRPFLDAGPELYGLLTHLHDELLAQPVLAETDPSPAYLQRLLQAFPAAAQSPPRATAHPKAYALVEPLTDRELEVLRLMAEGLTYQAVADRLIVSLNTVRYHVKSLYGKLGVDKRLAALDAARAAGLL